MPAGYEVEDPDTGQRAWWDGKKLTPLDANGMPASAQGGGKLTGEERTAGFLGRRVADSARNLADISRRNPRADRPGVIEAGATAINQPGIANLFRSSDRQKVSVNEIDLLDAALTLGTGAAYTKEQLEGQRYTYFPAFTDKPETVLEKRRKLLNLLEAAKIKAGGAAPPMIDEAILAAQEQYGMKPGSPANPTMLTSQNRASIKPGDRFRAGDGRVYTHTPGAGYRPGGAPAKPAQGGRGNLPPGVTAAEWSAMTPQERALFK
jgi:hypothetical protein